MPELPEVETIRRGLEPLMVGKVLRGAVVRNSRLRWPVPPTLGVDLSGARVSFLERRGKYLLLRTDHGTLIIHLGMSGSLRILPRSTPAGLHDHVDVLLSGGACLRLHDSRRFGCVLWDAGPIVKHPLLAGLGPEPLSHEFSGERLFRFTRHLATSAKSVLMDGRRIAGIGNIYANEALFLAGVRPTRRAARLSRANCDAIVSAVKTTLTRAIEAGGSTLRDFSDIHGSPGYFQQQYAVYGRTEQPCRACGRPVRVIRQGQRSSYFCPSCQR